MPEVSDSQAERTVQGVLSALRDSRTACLVQVVELIREITARPDSVSVQHLAALIERDVAVVAEVLRIANLLGFNPEGVEVTTVPQAIQVVGFTKIRNLAVSLLLLHSATGGDVSPEAREVSMLAVTSGYLAEVLAGQDSGTEAGFAFVCAALRRYGRLLLATFEPEACRAAVGQATPEDPEAGFRTRFGLTSLELGRRILAEQNLPGSILGGLREVAEIPPARRQPGTEAWTVVLGDAAVQTTDWLLAGSRPVSLEEASARLNRRLDGTLELTPAQLKSHLQELERRMALLRGPTAVTPLQQRLQRVVERNPLAPRPSAPGETAVPAAPAAPVDPVPLLLDGISQLTGLLEGPATRAEHVWRAGAESLRQALNLEDCCVFRRPAPAGGLLKPVLALGPRLQSLPIRAGIDPGAKTVFTLCLERAEIVVISRPGDPKIQPFLPSWLREAAGDDAILLLPVGSAGAVSAILCGLARSGEKFELPAGVRQHLVVLARLMALAGRVVQ